MAALACLKQFLLFLAGSKLHHASKVRPQRLLLWYVPAMKRPPFCCTRYVSPLHATCFARYTAPVSLRTILLPILRKSVALRSALAALFPRSYRPFWHLSVCCIAVCLRAIGGEVGATSSLAPKIGPLGLVRFSFTVPGAENDLARKKNLESCLFLIVATTDGRVCVLRSTGPRPRAYAACHMHTCTERFARA